MNVEIYSDVACPWCFIGERRFSRALAEFHGASDVDVVFRPFQLDPAAPAAGVPLRDHLAARYGARAAAMLARVSEVASGEGIVMDWDRAIAVNTAAAHRLARLAELEYGAGVQRALMTRLFEAHFTAGGDVADHEQLGAIAASVGMDPDRARRCLDSDEGVRDLDEALAQARRLGIHAVPTFVFDGRYMVQGAQSAAAFHQVLGEVARRAAAEAEAGDRGVCDDGSCAVVEER